MRFEIKKIKNHLKMNNKIVKILLSSFVILVIGFVGLKIYNYFTGIENFENRNVIKAGQEDKPILSSEIIEKDLDSVFHKEICLDFNNIWVSEDEKKIICFEYKSGKLLVYKNNEKTTDFSKLVNTPADNVFSWNFHEKRDDNKIIGEITYTEKDSLMYWVYDKSKNTLKDDKELVFNKITLKKHE
jgi:hypothetical protein